MRKTTSLLVALGAVATAGCSGSGTFANKPAPPQPINVTVYINDSKISASPTNVGAGPVNFVVTNQASKSETLTVLPAGSSAGQPLADTGPINPQGTAQVQVLFSKGDYTIATANGAGNDAGNAAPSSIAPITIHVGKPRSGESTQLLTP